MAFNTNCSKKSKNVNSFTSKQIKMNSLDPRVNKLNLQTHNNNIPTQQHEHWETYEVFAQNKRGEPHEHVGSLHAPDYTLALVFAKEQFGRRDRIFNLWIVKSSEIYAFDTADADMFSNNNDKSFRNANGFKVSDKITEYKKKTNKT